MIEKVTAGTRESYGKFETKSLKEAIPSNGTTDGDKETTLTGPTIGAKEVSTNETFTLEPVNTE
jgi:hypothetical protein